MHSQPDTVAKTFEDGSSVADPRSQQSLGGHSHDTEPLETLTKGNGAEVFIGTMNLRFVTQYIQSKMTRKCDSPQVDFTKICLHEYANVLMKEQLQHRVPNVVFVKSTESEEVSVDEVSDPSIANQYLPLEKGASASAEPNSTEQRPN